MLRGQYRFFYHYNKHNKAMTVHYKGICYACRNIVCRVACETKWNKTQPNLVMQGHTSAVELVGDTMYIG